MRHLKKVLYFVLVAFLICDLTYSYTQYSKMRLDGDLQESILPSEGYNTLYSSPFGYKAIIEGKSYPNTNRFFGHYTLKTVFTDGVQFLQNITNPVESVFLAAALSKLLFHFFLLFLLAACITGSFRIFSFDVILAMALISPLIQVHGYSEMMGITNTSITYVFFYSFPSVFLLLVVIPFVFLRVHRRNLFSSIPLVIFFGLSSLVLNFSGPLNPGSILIFFLVIYSFDIYKQSVNKTGTLQHRIWRSVFGLPVHFWFFALPVCLIALYSFYLGTYNANNTLYQKSLADMYRLLPEGFIIQFFEKIGYPLVLIVLLVNYFIIRYMVKTDNAIQLLRAYRFVLIFALIYILLLPLGGYRDYRPYILRSDSIIPITLSIFFLFGITTITVLKTLKNKSLLLYTLVLVCFLTILQRHDKIRDENSKEKLALHAMSASSEDLMVFDDDFTIVSWGLTLQPEESYIQIELMKIWNIIDKNEHKHFYQAPPAVE
jgi:hypothetical protein